MRCSIARLIHTCELTDANPFDYLAELQAANPSPVDALELPRDIGAVRHTRSRVI
jgi:hypothetical protein